MALEESSDSILLEHEVQNKWTDKNARLLLDERLKLESEFKQGKRKKSTLWSIVLRNIKQIDLAFPFSKEEIQKKFNNMFTTYTRIKKRNKESGREATFWIYFGQFNEVYGTSYTIDPPSNTIIQSFTPEENDSCEEIESSQKRNKKSRHEDGVMKFLKEESKKDDKRFDKLIEIEKESLEIERGKVKELVELKEILLKYLDD